MKKNLNHRKSAIFFKSIALISLVIILFACEGSNENISSETGSLRFNLEWQEQPTSYITENYIFKDKILNLVEIFFPSARADVQDDICNKNVVKIAVIVKDENNSTLKELEFFCSYHTGTIADIKAGTNRKVIVTGYDSNTKALYQGKKENVSITAGQTTTIKDPIICSSVTNIPLVAKIARPSDWSKYSTNTPIGFSSNGSSGQVYDWDFGDGTHSTEANPSHTYKNENLYPVTLIVRDNSGTFKSISSISLNISNSSSDPNSCGKLSLTGITPPAILENGIREYTITGSGFCRYTTIFVDIGAFVGNDPQKPANSQPSYVNDNGTELKIYIYAAKTPDKNMVKIMAKNPGEEEIAELSVGFQR